MLFQNKLSERFILPAEPYISGDWYVGMGEGEGER